MRHGSIIRSAGHMLAVAKQLGYNQVKRLHCERARHRRGGRIIANTDRVIEAFTIETRFVDYNATGFASG
jgi:hypothetical protein